MDEKELRKLLEQNPDLAAENESVFRKQDRDLQIESEEQHQTIAPRMSVGQQLCNQLTEAATTANIPPAEAEYKLPGLGRYRIDVAIPDLRLAIEVEGGIWMSTASGRSKGHAHPKRFLSDMKKYNLISRERWFLLRYTPEQVQSGDALFDIIMIIQEWRNRPES